jgi:hypothetical protein
MNMPNWCTNYLELDHADPDELKKIRAAMGEGKFFDSIIPLPEVLRKDFKPEDAQANQLACGFTDWYTFCTTEWGTKWDPSGQEYYFGDADGDEDEVTIAVRFETAWAPPVGIYRELLKRGFKVEAYWVEEGVGFCGCFVNGTATDYDIPETAEEAERLIPPNVLYETELLELLYEREGT